MQPLPGAPTIVVVSDIKLMLGGPHSEIRMVAHGRQMFSQFHAPRPQIESYKYPTPMFGTFGLSFVCSCDTEVMLDLAYGGW